MILSIERKEVNPSFNLTPTLFLYDGYCLRYLTFSVLGQEYTVSFTKCDFYKLFFDLEIYKIFHNLGNFYGFSFGWDY